MHFVLFKAYHGVFLIAEQVLDLHRGQGMDIYWRDSYKCPTEQEYTTMVIQSNFTFVVII